MLTSEEGKHRASVCNGPKLLVENLTVNPGSAGKYFGNALMCRLSHRPPAPPSPVPEAPRTSPAAVGEEAGGRPSAGKARGPGSQKALLFTLLWPQEGV